MARWTDLAQWRGPTVNQGGPMVEHRGVVVHIAEGSYEGTIAWQRNPDASVSSHFVVGLDGAIAQVVDTDVTAWTQRAGNGHWLSIENAGFTPNALTPAQVEANARILARAHIEYGVPLQMAVTPDGRGLGHHSMGAHPGYPDDWGHSACPGPAIIAQKPAILARAIAIVNGEDDDMFEQADRDKLNEMHLAVTQGLRPGTNQTSGGGVPIAWLPRQFYEVDQAVAAVTSVASALTGAQSRIEAKLAELADAEQDDSPVGGVTAAQVGEIVNAELREVFLDAGTAD